MWEGIKNQESRTINKLSKTNIGRDYVGRDKIVHEHYEYKEKVFENLTPTADAKPVWYFTGRETELDSLCKGIDRGEKAVLVSGMGGIGKTQICRTLYQEYLTGEGKGLFSHIGYFTYDTDLGTTLVNGMGIRISSDEEENREAAWGKLYDVSRTGRLLLFVDNFNNSLKEDPEMKRLCKLQGALVVSSRRKSLGDFLKPYPIGFLSMEECRGIYEKIQKEGGRIVREEETGSLCYIIEKLAGFHTITVEFLSFLARTKHWDADRLRQELEQKGFHLQFHKDGEIINIQESYEALYDLSELSEGEKNILEAFSAFPYLPLDFETLNRWLLKDAGASEEDDIIEGLYQKGWLQFFGEQDSYAMHPVFAKFIYDKCKPAAEEHMGMIEACEDDIRIPEDGCALECQRYLPFALELINKIRIDESEIWRKFSADIAWLLSYTGKYKSAERIYKEIKRNCEEELGERHPYTADSYHNLGYVYYREGKYEEAEELYRKTLRIIEEILGERHPYTAVSYNNLAGVYDSQGRYEEAEELYRKALKIREEIQGERHPDTAVSYNNLAGVYARQGKYEEAEELYRKALKIREEILGERHPDTADSYHNLAYVYARQGRYEEAEELYRKALKIREEILGERHPNTAVSYHNLAGVYDREGRYEEAEELYRKALKIREEILGERHPDTADSYNNLAGVYARQGRYEEAEELYRKALKIREEIQGERHPDTAVSYHNLAYVYDSQGKYEEAEELYRKALKIREEILGERHPDTAGNYNNLAGVYDSQGKYEEAEELYRKALKIREEILGERHPDISVSYNNLAYVYASQGKYKEAEELYIKALKISEDMLGENHPTTAIFTKNLASLYQSQGRHEEAEKLLQRISEI